MALHKEPYSLIYNDDGSLCVTQREDDVPFPGMEAFAVEEGTTNEVTNQDAFTLYSTAQATRELVTDGSFKGWYKVTATHTGNYGIIAFLQCIAVADGETKTWSIDFYSPSGKVWPYLTGGVNVGILTQISKYRRARTWTNNTGVLKNLGIYFDTNYAADVDINEVFYYRWYQVESKPFATSFVDGTRQYGQMVKPIAKKENAVWAGWFKPIGVYDGTSSSGEEARIVNYENDDRVASLRFQYQKGTGATPLQTFGLRVTIDSSTYKYVHTSKTYPPNQWYFWVLILDNGLYQAYIFDVDGSYEILTNDLSLASVTISQVCIGCRPNTSAGVANGLIANIYYGKYRNDAGNIIWTDKLIKQVYQACQPFSTPPKIPII